ncbi:MAG TPA: hypothetical protein VKA34_05115 [Balneolales bacterium]|nr:hypothetical protein [Balneolales bacterium]
MVSFSLSNPSVWLDLFIIGAIVKFVSAFISARWPGGTRTILETWRGILVYSAGKISPLVAIGAVLIYYKMSHPSIKTWWLVLAFAALFIYDAYVVWLRLTNRWYGAADKLKPRETPKDD